MPRSSGMCCSAFTTRDCGDTFCSLGSAQYELKENRREGCGECRRRDGYRVLHLRVWSRGFLRVQFAPHGPGKQVCSCLRLIRPGPRSARLVQGQSCPRSQAFLTPLGTLRFPLSVCCCSIGSRHYSVSFPVSLVSGDDISFFWVKSRPPLAFQPQTFPPHAHEFARERGFPAPRLLTTSLRNESDVLPPPVGSLFLSVHAPTHGPLAPH